MAAGFFYSKTFKIIATVILSVELIIIITLKVVDLYCDEPGCWNKKDWGTNYCMEHINSIYEEAMKRERAYEKDYDSKQKSVEPDSCVDDVCDDADAVICDSCGSR